MWALNPAAKGVGISMCIISLVVAIYYNVIMAYTLFYFFSSMQKTLPWTKCQEVGKGNRRGGWEGYLGGEVVGGGVMGRRGSVRKWLRD